MAVVFLGGSRHLRSLPDAFRQRLDSVVNRGHEVLVGDADGADAAIQAHLRAAGHLAVTVFHSGRKPRFDVGGFATRCISTPAGASGYGLHAFKDRSMAEAADFGLMAWDGRSPGTVMNVLRLLNQEKPSVLFSARDSSFRTIKTPEDRDAFLASAPNAARLLSDLHARGAGSEGLLPSPEQPAGRSPSP